MRILFDHGTPRPLKNGLLLEAAEKNDFDILITTDKDMRFQQNLRLRRIGIIVLENGKWPDVKMFVPKILEAINEAKAGVSIVVACFEA